jgi:hypothetical protein
MASLYKEQLCIGSSEEIISRRNFRMVIIGARLLKGKNPAWCLGI